MNKKYTIEDLKNRVATRADISGHVTHLTKENTLKGRKYSELDILLKILKEKKLIGSSPSSAFICGNEKAVCLQATPPYYLAQNIYYELQYRKRNSKTKIRYQGAGIMFTKHYVYRKGGRPVIYDKLEVAKQYLREEEHWRIVSLDLSTDNSIVDWTHEREWRIPGDFDFDWSEATVLVLNSNMYRKFIKRSLEMENGELLTQIKGIINLSAVFL